MDERDRFDEGMRMRRRVLGDEHVDRAERWITVQTGPRHYPF